MVVREVRSGQLSDDEVAAIRELLWAAFPPDHEDGGITEDDWQHALGGTHFLLEDEGGLVGHASVVERRVYSVTSRRNSISSSSRCRHG